MRDASRRRSMGTEAFMAESSASEATDCVAPATPASVPASEDVSAAPFLGETFPSITFFSRGNMVLNSRSAKSFDALSRSIHSLQPTVGSFQSIGASRRMVASTFENSASSSPAVRSSMIRAVIPASLNFSTPSSALRALYMSSIGPKVVIRVVAVFSPIPLMPIMLSDGSPRRPL